MSWTEIFGLSTALLAVVLTLNWYRRRFVTWVLRNVRQWYRRRHLVWRGGLLAVWGIVLLVLGMAELAVQIPEEIVRKLWPDQKKGKGNSRKARV